MNLIATVKQFFFGDARTSRLSKNILYSFFTKGYALAIQLALVPITLGYLDKFHYGIWLVMASIIEWFAYFDIGIGDGLRNRLSEALAKGNMELARIFTSTSYALITVIFTGFILIFLLVNPFLDWAAILNVSAEQGTELSEVVLFVFIFFCIRFILSLITPIIYANQDPAINSFMGPLGSTVSLIAIILLSKYVTGSLYWIAIIFSAAPLLVMIVFSVALFSTRYKQIRPSIHHVNFSYSKNLLGLGIGFFIINISMLVMYSSGNIILTQLFGPEEVTVYNIAMRYFTITSMVHGIIILPYWSSFTEAYFKNDIPWIKNAMRKLNYISIALIGGVLISLFMSDFLINLWVGSSIKVPLSMKLAFCANVSVYLLVAPYNIFINGASKIKLQLFVAIISIFVTVPLAIVFSKTLNIGPAGVVLAIVCSTLPGGIVWRIQYHKLINGTVTGIWNK